MKKTNKIIMTVAIVAVLLLGIGYAAIQNITLNIAGTAAADPSQANFKVMFSGTPTVSDDTYVTAAVTDDTNATISVEGLTKKGDIVTATYTVQNASEDLSADLAVSTTNSNTEYFSLTSEIEETSLVAGEATTLTVTVELTKTPIVESVSTTIGVQLEAMPVQPGEEGTSEGINDFSETPDKRNEFGFYFEQPYSATIEEEKMTIVFYENETINLYVDGKIMQQEEPIDLLYEPLKISVIEDEEVIDFITISSNGRKLYLEGVEFEIDKSFVREKIPAGSMYFNMNVSNLTATILNVMPIYPAHGDVYISGDYLYAFDSSNDGWGVMVFQDVWKTILNENLNIKIECETTDGNQTSYEPILEEICGAPIVNMSETFMGCANLITAPEIPSGVKSMSSTFAHCVSLKEAPVLPDGIEDLSSTFSGCVSLEEPPVIPNTVTGLVQAFYGCTSLKSAPVIPNGVTAMHSAFAYCTSLENVPSLPDSRADMSATFKECTSLKTVPAIPNNVYSMDETFYNCTSLTGEIIINTDPIYYNQCFFGVDFAAQNLTLKGESTMLDEIGATGNNYTANP